jgi:hypothetical protein
MCVETSKMFLESVFMNVDFEPVKRQNKMLIFVPSNRKLLIHSMG